VNLSVPNIIVIMTMLVLFVLALVIPRNDARVGSAEY
jgi:hypothetical protein